MKETRYKRAKQKLVYDSKKQKSQQEMKIKADKWEQYLEKPYAGSELGEVIGIYYRQVEMIRIAIK